MVLIDSSDTLNKTKILGSGCECSRSFLFKGGRDVISRVTSRNVEGNEITARIICGLPRAQKLANERVFRLNVAYFRKVLYLCTLYGTELYLGSVFHRSVCDCAGEISVLGRL